MQSALLMHFAALVAAATSPSSATTAHAEPDPPTARRRMPSLTHAESRWPYNDRCKSGAPLCSEQVHVQLGGDGEMVVVFATRDDTVPSTVTWWRASDGDARAGDRVSEAHGSVQVVSSIMYVDEMLQRPAVGAPGDSTHDLLRRQNASYHRHATGTRDHHHKSDPDGVVQGIGMYFNPEMYYESPLLHTVRLSPLVGGVQYNYVVAGDEREFTFRMPPDRAELTPRSYPFFLGLTADLGQTPASEANVALLERLLLGAPGAKASGGAVMLLAGDLSYADGWPSRWDSYARMIEPLAARMPIMTTPGNHELVPDELFAAYNARYPMPHASSRSPSNLWWSRDVGPIHLLSLCSYCATGRTSLQYRWLLRDLAAVDRTQTPWLIVMLHVPWYHSNSNHPDEGDPMRKSMEDALYAAGADLVLAGHIHAYERTLPVYNKRVNECGIVHLTLGDGGNREGAALPWVTPAPEWSAFREGSFGVGSLQIVNDTHALYNWTRTSCETADADERIDFHAETCESVALGPWSFGGDDAPKGNPQSDPVWIVRRANRQSCAPPASGDGWSVTATTMQAPAMAAAGPSSSGGGGIGGSGPPPSHLVPYGLMVAALAALGVATYTFGGARPADARLAARDEEMAAAADVENEERPYVLAG